MADVRVLESGEDRDSVGGGDYRDDVFGVIAVGTTGAKLGVVWSETSEGRRKRSWNLIFRIPKDDEVRLALAVPTNEMEKQNVFGEKPWPIRQRKLWNALCGRKELLSMERDTRDVVNAGMVNAEGSYFDADAAQELLSLAACTLPIEDLFAHSLRALSQSRSRPDVFDAFTACSTRVKQPAVRWMQAFRSLAGKTEPQVVAGGSDAEEDDDEKASSDSESAGSDGAFPHLDTAWHKESKDTHKLFKCIRGGDVDAVHQLLGPSSSTSAAETNVASCSLCLEAYAGDDKVVSLTCNSSGCPAVFHPWCCRKWHASTPTATCPLCRTGVVLEGTFKQVNLSAMDGDGFGPLHHACFNNKDPRMVAALVKWGCNIESKNPMEETPLHLAAMYRHPEHIRVLLDAGARTDVVDWKGCTPLERAKNSWMGFGGDGQEDCAKMLEANKLSMTAQKSAEEARVAGNIAFKERNWESALEHYTAAIAVNGADCRSYCNRAAVLLEVAKASTSNPEKRLLFTRGLEDAVRCTTLDSTFEKGHYRAALCQMGLKDFPRALIAVKHGLKTCSASRVLRQLGAELKKCGIKDNIANPFTATARAMRMQSQIAEGCPTQSCAWCRVLIPTPCDEYCPHCACDPKGSGVGELAAKYGVEWVTPA